MYRSAQRWVSKVGFFEEVLDNGLSQAYHAAIWQSLVEMTWL